MNGSTLLARLTARWSRQWARSRIASCVTKSTHGTRKAAENSARDSATMPVPNTGTARRMKMYCTDHRVASSSHRPAADEVTPLEVHALQCVGRVAQARARAGRCDIRDARHVGSGKPDLERVEVLVDALLPLRPGDRHDVLALREEPCEHELRRRALLLRRHLLEALHDLHVLVEMLALEARMGEAPVAVGQVRLALHRAGKHAAPERRIRDERDAELARRLQRLLAFDAIEQRILVLHGRDRMDLVRAADGLRARFREPDRA